MLSPEVHSARSVFSLPFSQGRKQRSVQFFRTGSYHLGFDNELIARFQVE
jgi:hypothetical protein